MIRPYVHVALAALVPPAFAAAPDDDSFAIVDVHVVPMTAEVVLEHRTVIVRDGIIVEIAPADELEVPDDLRRVDGAHRHLLPGYVDAHTHLSSPDQLLLCLASGVTTVFDLGGGDERLAWRDAIARRELTGPTMLAARRGIVGVTSVGPANRRVADEAAAGWDILKPYDNLSAEVFAALVDGARERGMSSFVHVPRNLTPPEALRARPTAIAHAEEFLYSWLLPDMHPGRIEETVRMTLDAGSAVVANLVAYDTIARQLARPEHMLDRGELRYVPYPVRRTWEPGNNRYLRDLRRTQTPRRVVDQHRRSFALLRDLVLELDRAGVSILVGSDASYEMPFVVPGFAAVEELRQLVAAGLSPYRALVAATRAPAEVVGRGDEVGTIEVGKRADLVLVAGNPLRDIECAGQVVGVAARGRWYSGERMRGWLDELAGSYAADEPAIRVLFADGYDGRARSPGAARGEPDAFDATQYGNAWFPRDEDADDWLELDYATPTPTVAVLVHGTAGQRGITALRLRLAGGGDVLLSDPVGRPVATYSDGLGATRFDLGGEHVVAGVRLEINHRLVIGSDVVDAVALVDPRGDRAWAVAVRASSSLADHRVGTGAPTDSGTVPVGAVFERPDTATLCAMADAAIAAGDDERGLVLLRAAYRWSPGSAQAAFALGDACLRLGRATEGERTLRRCLELDPEHERARGVLERALRHR